MATQPGGQSAAERFPRAALFLDENGVLNEYARRAHHRALADLMYLALWRKLGAQEAANRVCAAYGHDVRAGVCERCGAR